MTTADTRLAVLLGSPVLHSLSPAMFTRAFLAARLDATFVAWDTAAAAFPRAVSTLAAVKALGASVTTPHKQHAAKLMDTLGPEARAIQAVNCISFGEDGLRGDNTDVYGFLQILRHLRLRKGPVVVVGAGGAARAVVYALLSHGDFEVHLTARRLERARALTRRLGGVPHDFSERGRLFAQAVAVVHATSASVRGEALPIDASTVDSRAWVIDLTYGATPLVRAARQHGLKVIDGSIMLLHQAVRAFGLWTGKKAPVAAMRAALGGEMSSTVGK